MKTHGDFSGAVLTIDLNAIRNNYRLLCARAKHAVCAAVLKADAYGLGAARIASMLTEEGCRHLFVAHLDEGIALRPHVPPDACVYVLHGSPVGAEKEFLRHDLIPVLNSIPQICAWRKLADSLALRLPTIIQVDSGMSRLGLSAKEVEKLASRADIFDRFDLRYLMSHLACAEHLDHPSNAAQLAKFVEARKHFPFSQASLANSSGIFLEKNFHFDLVRPGAALYGIAPTVGNENPLAQAVRLQGKIIQTRTIDAGAGVGYGLTFRAADRRTVATVSIGYADGWFRSFSNRGQVSIGGQTVPMIGNVSMDTITIDVTDIPCALLTPGSLVDLISQTRTVDFIAAAAGTIAYELLTSLGHRYHREYIDCS
jgi:alanine racemase